MTLRQKLLTYIGLAIVALLLLLYVIALVQTRHDYMRLEERQMSQAVAQMKAAINNDVSFLNSTAVDWAHRDDTYRFVGDCNQPYIDTNLTDSVLANLQLNLMLFVDRSGRLVYVKAFDLQQKRAISLRKEILDTLLADTRLFPRRRIGTHASGIIHLDSGPMLVVSQQILPSIGDGAARGTLVLGRCLDQRAVSVLEDRTRLQLDLRPLNDVQLPADSREVRAKLTPAYPLFIHPVDRNTVAGYALLDDLHNRPYLMAKIVLPRDMYRQGTNSMRLLVGTLLLAGLFFGLLVIILTEYLVLRPLEQFSSGVNRIRANRDLSSRLTIRGRDELATVAIAINGMLQSLEQSQEQLQESEACYRGIVEDQMELICRFAPDGLLTFVNEAYCRYYQKRRDELLSQSFTTNVFHEDLAVVRQQIAGLHLVCPVAALEHRVVLPGGRILWQQWTYRGIFDERGARTEVQAVGRDITDRKEAADRLNYLAYYDSLSGLANRMLFNERLTYALAHTQRVGGLFAVALLDLDRFKEVNDVLGHDIGDRLLQQVAERLQSCIRKSDTVARFGGDEFIFILDDLKAAHDVEITARRLQDAFQKPFVIDIHELYISSSIGICLAPMDGDTIDTLIKNADVAMYRAKAEGRNAYQFFSPEMASLVSQHRKIEDQLRKAIELHELSVYYQPIVAGQSQAITGVEALVRWRHPERGLMEPAEFIAVAEESGLVTAIDFWVLATACRQAVAWQRQGLPPIRMAVNLSARHFHQHTLVETVATALRESGLQPDLLELEITENAAMKNMSVTQAMLEELAALNVRIVIDDFGIGYSSLNYVRYFPVDTVKIDGSFIQDVIDDPKSAAIVQATIDLAHALGREVTAEAVVTPAQVAFLQNVQCDRLQGFFFGAPMPAEEVAGVLDMARMVTPGRYQGHV